MLKGSQHYAKIDTQICAFAYFLEKDRKCKITLPLEREHDFTGSEHLELHEQSAQNTYRIDATRRHAKGMETNIKIKPKWERKSMEIKKHTEKICRK